MNDVTRAPLVPSDSLETWTRTSWPRLSICSIGATGSRRGGSASSTSASATSSASSAGSATGAASTPRLAVRVSLELPHPHGEQEPEAEQGDQHGRAAIAHQRQGHAHHGQEAGDHSDVDEHLRREQGRDPERDQAAHRLARRRRDVETAEQQQRVAGEQHQAPDEPPRLGEYGEDEIRVTLREKGEPALRGAGDALAQELS